MEVLNLLLLHNVEQLLQCILMQKSIKEHYFSTTTDRNVHFNMY